jgi:hypothetical protein
LNKRILTSATAALVVAGSATAAFAASGTTATGSDGFTPVTQTRVFDSGHIAGDAMLASGASQVITLPTGLVPAGADAVEIQITAASEASVSGDLEAYADGVAHTPGTTSNLNYVRGVNITSDTVVKLGADGAFDVYNHGGTAGNLRLVVDVLGYFAAPAAYVPPTSTTWTLPAASQGETINTGGSAVSRATLLGTVQLTAGTYQVSLNAKATPDLTSATQIFPAFFVYSQPLDATFAGNQFNVGSGALESGGNTNIDSYFSGNGTVVVPAGGETLSIYGFGYDSDRGEGTYLLDTAEVTAVPISQ